MCCPCLADALCLKYHHINRKCYSSSILVGEWGVYRLERTPSCPTRAANHHLQRSVDTDLGPSNIFTSSITRSPIEKNLFSSKRRARTNSKSNNEQLLGIRSLITEAVLRTIVLSILVHDLSPSTIGLARCSSGVGHGAAGQGSS